MTFSTIALLSFAVQSYAQHALKALPLGRSGPVGTLIAQPSAIPLSSASPYAKQNGSQASREDLATMDAAHDLDDVANSDGDGHDTTPTARITVTEYGLYVPEGDEGGVTLVKPSLQKRFAFRGTMMMDCKRALEACQNACWYQNCMQGAQGDPTRVTYTHGSGNNNAANRVEAGTTISTGTPCQNWPWGQRFWDTYPWKQRGYKHTDRGKDLQTDEWPMADIQNPIFNPNANPPQHSLRCITGTDNSRGSTEWVVFRNGGGKYKTGGKWADKRFGTGRFVNGDTFNVDFDFSGFDNNDPEDVKAQNDLLYYCRAPFNNCQNYGRQFHMSSIAHSTTRPDRAGTWAWPYDTTASSTYRIDKEVSDTDAYFVTVEMTENDDDGNNNPGTYTQLKTTVQHYRDGDYINLASATTEVKADGDSMTVQGGTLPQQLVVKKITGDGCNAELDFTYGTPADNSVSWCNFKSTDKGLKRDAPSWRKDHNYCVPGDLLDSDGDFAGYKIDCTFPGW